MWRGSRRGALRSLESGISSRPGMVRAMPLIEIPDVDIWYEDTGGTGRPVVFVHPAAATSAGWENQVSVFRAAGYRCIIYDQRGWGRSRERPGAADRGHASSDLEALTQALG